MQTKGGTYVVKCQKMQIWFVKAPSGGAIYHSIDPGFDAKVAEIFLNGTYCTGT